MGSEAVGVVANRHYRFAILGAGLAGLSLARALARAGVPGDVVILDAKRGFADDRTWSFWDVDGGDDARLASGVWHRWQLTDATGSYVQHASGVPYVSIESRHFYSAALAEIEAAGYEIALGERVRSVVEGVASVRVGTPSRELTADFVFDARGLTGAMVGRAAVVQRFVGARITTPVDTFDSSTATLMDVRPDVADGFHFFYVLPLGPREALVENTYFARRPIANARLERELDAYVRQATGGVDFSVRFRERGAIPMSTKLRLPEATRRVVPIGLRGGCGRAGSGYTFHRVQQQAVALAARLLRGGEPASRSLAPRPQRCDAVLIAAARHAPELLPVAFRRLFATTDGRRFARFMMDRAGPLESAPVVTASALGALEAALHGAGRPRVATAKLATR